MMSMVQPTKLDGKKAWKAYMRLGSWEKVRAQEEFTNPITDKQYAKFTIIAAAKSWLFDTTHPENYAEGRNDWNNATRQRGVVPTDEMWKEHARRWAGNAFYYRPTTYAEVVRFFNLDDEEGVGRLVSRRNKVKELTALVKEVNRLAALPSDGSEPKDGESDDPTTILSRIAEMTK